MNFELTKFTNAHCTTARILVSCDRIWFEIFEIINENVFFLFNNGPRWDGWLTDKQEKLARHSPFKAEIYCAAAIKQSLFDLCSVSLYLLSTY